jgi:hypothetical protein
MPFKRVWRVTGARFSQGHKGSRETRTRIWSQSSATGTIAAAKARGVASGSLLHGTRRSAVASIKAEADRRAANVLPIIREAQKAGATTLRQIAEALNARGVATARGGQWYRRQ